jgi:hypothetical protein
MLPNVQVVSGNLRERASEREHELGVEEMVPGRQTGKLERC